LTAESVTLSVRRVSTFMAFGCVDLRADADVEQFLLALDRAVSSAADAGEPLTVNIGERAGRPRLSLYANYGNPWFGNVLAQAAEATGAVERAIVGLDHDEYGIEHVILDGRDGRLARVQHVYVYPDGEPDAEFGPTLTDLPVRHGLATSPDGVVDGPRSWAVVAALFDIPPERIVSAARQMANAHEELGVVFRPFAPWWDSLDVVYPGDLGPADVTLTGRR
jgi:hypothetical protein